MYFKYLNDPNFFMLLYKIDRDLALQYRQRPCPHCKKVIHFANYRRKGRYIMEEFSLRFSLCCSNCRKRVPVPSTLYFGPFVYGSIFFFIISCFINGHGFRYKYLSQIFKISDRTLRRWKRWWNSTFKTSIFWKQKKALFTNLGEKFPLDIIQQFDLIKKMFLFFSYFNHRPEILRRGC